MTYIGCPRLTVSLINGRFLRSFGDENFNTKVSREKLKVYQSACQNFARSEMRCPFPFKNYNSLDILVLRFLSLNDFRNLPFTDDTVGLGHSVSVLEKLSWYAAYLIVVHPASLICHMSRDTYDSETLQKCTLQSIIYLQMSARAMQ